MRTQEQIVAEIERVKNEDFFGFRTTDLIGFLDFEHAKPYLIEGAKEEDWVQTPNDRDSILNQMEDYMEFAWEKANNGRGISAARSMDHYSVWIWMLGDEHLVGDVTNYEFYGKDNLRKICEVYGWDADQWDDGVREN